ncbi:hypothetical protein M5689_024656 [Euphorbia peplus]|nr:hypothetical protein M5689_002998 [Euphorbia peplus]WCJ43953.1 hypothetical protein M5689_024656 [Euphorbia peplus]
MENRRNNSRRATYRSRARGKDCLWRARFIFGLVSTEAILASGAPGDRMFRIGFSSSFLSTQPFRKVVRLPNGHDRSLKVVTLRNTPLDAYKYTILL